MASAVEQALSLKNVAVVGLSRDPAKAAHTVPRYLQMQGYKIYPVNPFGGSELLGEKVYNRVSEIEGVVIWLWCLGPQKKPCLWWRMP